MDASDSLLARPPPPFPSPSPSHFHWNLLKNGSKNIGWASQSQEEGATRSPPFPAEYTVLYTCRLRDIASRHIFRFVALGKFGKNPLMCAKSGMLSLLWRLGMGSPLAETRGALVRHDLGM
eukprot:1041044-Amorphochlora_amoeboformis.AAC.1